MVFTSKGPLFSFVKPSTAALSALVRQQREERLSYSQVGATRADLPAGYRHVRQVTELGRGEGVFRRAVEGLRKWQAHVHAGVELNPPRPTRGGARRGVGGPRAPMYVAVACRIVYVTEHPGRFELAYGTLPHHVIEGEEAFIAERVETDTVRFAIAAFFRPRGGALRPVAPLVHLLDERLVRRYLRGMQQHVTHAGSL